MVRSSIFVACLTLVAVGCHSRSTAATSTTSTKAEGAPVPAVAAPATTAPAKVAMAAPVARGSGVTVDGLTVSFPADGTVVVTGKNRWGSSLDATYQDYGYFSRAVPVLARQVTPKQASALKQLVQQRPDTKGAQQP